MEKLDSWIFRIDRGLGQSLKDLAMMTKILHTGAEKAIRIGQGRKD